MSSLELPRLHTVDESPLNTYVRELEHVFYLLPSVWVYTPMSEFVLYARSITVW